MPLLRLEGAIDAHGLELQDLCGLPAALRAETEAAITQLREQELAFKARGRWLKLDLVEYTAALLRAVDALVYSSHQFDDVEEIEELARVRIGSGGIAIVCRSPAGIYEVERELRRLHGARLGVIVLRTGPTAYTVRQVDARLPGTLESLYDHLNLVDPAAGGSRSANRWGGSAELGGSPRASGTRLTSDQIARACGHAFARPTVLQRVSWVAGAVLQTGNILLAALACVFVLGSLGDPVALQTRLAPNLGAQFAILLGALGAAILLLRGLRSPGLHGLRRPVGVDWCFVVPVAIAGALAGGVWVPGLQGAAGSRGLELGGLLALPLAAEVIFRGLFHAALATRFHTQRCAGRWFLSWPTVVSAVLYALWGTLLQQPPVSLVYAASWATNAVPALLGGVVFGVAAGMARERSESVVPSIVLHWLCVALVVCLLRP
jgi:membrane protease YdiL (CAAX protease family)